MRGSLSEDNNCIKSKVDYGCAVRTSLYRYGPIQKSLEAVKLARPKERHWFYNVIFIYFKTCL